MAYPARFLIATLFALALSVGFGWAMEEPSPLAPPDPPVLEPPAEVFAIPDAPLGLSKGGERYALISNPTWQGARSVKPIRKADPNSYEADLRQNHSYIWAPTCLPSAQKVVFQHDFYLPGPAKNFAAEIQGTKYGIKLIRVFINGSLAFHTNTYPFYILLAENRYAKMLNTGNNIITIEVTKLPDTAANKFCQNGPLGIAFKLYGEFSADLGVAKSGFYKVAVHPDTDTRVLLFTGTPQLRNHGPSAVYKAYLSARVTYSGSPITKAELIPVGNSISACQELFTGPTVTGMDCAFTKWAPGTPKSFPFGIRVETEGPGNPNFVSNVGIYYGVSSPTDDPNTANNFRSVTVYVCYPGNVKPECNGSLSSY
jgi:hypothetical protein